MSKRGLLAALLFLSLARPALATHEQYPWRVAYFEGGPYSNYVQVFYWTVIGLMADGILPANILPAPSGEDARPLWDWLVANHFPGDKLVFLKDGFYSADWHDPDQLADQFITRLTTKKDVELVIAMGTIAGQQLANDRHSIATVVMSSSDPVQSGIIKSLYDSGRDHVHAAMDPWRFQRQLRVFHAAVKFKRLGIFFEDTSAGRSYAAMADAEAIGHEVGFVVVPCFTISDTKDIKTAEDSALACMTLLLKKSDAIYVTEQGGVTPRTLPLLAKMAKEAKIPTFSQTGKDEVIAGIMMSMSDQFKAEGLFQAKVIARVIRHQLPREIPQVFDHPHTTIINRSTVRAIGIQLPAILWESADVIIDNNGRRDE